MHFSSAVAGLVLLVAPSIAASGHAWAPSGAPSGPWDTTTTEYQATTTITMTLLQVNATVTSHLPKATGYNATFSATGASYNPATVNPTAQPSVCQNCMQGNGASSGHVNVAVAAAAGAAALFWASL